MRVVMSASLIFPKMFAREVFRDSQYSKPKQLHVENIASRKYASSVPRSDPLPLRLPSPRLDDMLVPDGPQRDAHAGQTGPERDPVRRAVAFQAVGAVALAVGEDSRVVVVNCSFNDISVPLLKAKRLERVP
jgi:hypothetical protein